MIERWVLVQREGKQPFLIRHIETPQWLDNQTTSTNMIRTICRLADTLPLFSHCSAGVGRSGIVALYALLERGEYLAGLFKRDVDQLSGQQIYDAIGQIVDKLMIRCRLARSFAPNASIIQKLPQYQTLRLLATHKVFGHEAIFQTSDA